MKYIYLIIMVITMYSCNNTDNVITTPTIQKDSIIYINNVCDSLQAKLDSIENSKLNQPEYFIVTWSSNHIGIIVLNMRHYDYVITHMDDSRINGKLDRDRLMSLCNFINKNRVTRLDVDSYDRLNYKISKYNVIKIVNFPEMMVYY